MFKMKKIYLLIICLHVSVFGQIKIQDAFFAEVLKDFYPQCITANGILDTLCSKQSKNSYLHISGKYIQDISEVIWFKHLDSLDIDTIGLKILPKLPQELTSLWCSSHFILDSVVLPLPQKLRHLTIGNNRFKKMDLYDMVYLEYIHLYEDSLNNIIFPRCLKHLIIHSIDLSVDLKFPKSLNILQIYNVNLDKKRIDLPHGLQKLTLSGCNLSELPQLPNSLVTLEIPLNGLKKIYSLPSNLKSFSAQNNKLELLPFKLPDKLHTLNIHNNYLKFMPKFNSRNLKYIDARVNCFKMEYKDRSDGMYSWKFVGFENDCK